MIRSFEKNGNEIVIFRVDAQNDHIGNNRNSPEAFRTGLTVFISCYRSSLVDRPVIRRVWAGPYYGPGSDL